MSSPLTLRERLREGLKRTREKLGLGFDGEVADWDALEESLLLADVGLPATREILEALRSRRLQGSTEVQEGLRDALLAIVERPGTSAPAESSAGPRPRVTMIVGVNGVGKTTSVAKLAQRMSSEGKRVLVVAADTFRAAAQEQLETWTGRIGVELVRGEPGRDPASVVHDGLSRASAAALDEVLIDTAGRLHTKQPLMDELAKVGRVAGRIVSGAPHETLLVLDGTVGTNGLSQARRFTEGLPVTGILLTKMDGTARGGVVVAIAKELELPVRYTGVGEGAFDLLPFSASDFVDALLG
jgi:fused signal recognition particle receptor